MSAIHYPSKRLIGMAGTCVACMRAARSLLTEYLIEDGWTEEEARDKVEFIWKRIGEMDRQMELMT